MSDKYGKIVKLKVNSRHFIDKEDWFFNPDKMTWAEAQANIPLCADITPKRFDLLPTLKAHVEEVIYRNKNGESSRWDDTPTQDLIDGIDRAMAYIENNQIFQIEEDKSWKPQESTKSKSKTQD